MTIPTLSLPEGNWDWSPFKKRSVQYFLSTDLCVTPVMGNLAFLAALTPVDTPHYYSLYWVAKFVPSVTLTVLECRMIIKGSNTVFTLYTFKITSR